MKKRSGTRSEKNKQDHSPQSWWENSTFCIMYWQHRMWGTTVSRWTTNRDAIEETGWWSHSQPQTNSLHHLHFTTQGGYYHDCSYGQFDYSPVTCSTHGAWQIGQAGRFWIHFLIQWAWYPWLHWDHITEHLPVGAYDVLQLTHGDSNDSWQIAQVSVFDFHPHNATKLTASTSNNGALFSTGT